MINDVHLDIVPCVNLTHQENKKLLTAIHNFGPQFPLLQLTLYNTDSLVVLRQVTFLFTSNNTILITLVDF